MTRLNIVRWLVEQALPTWGRSGADLAAGGFFEKIDLQGRAVEAPRRTRVVARQIYVFATAARRGWLPGADGLVERGLEFLLVRQRQPNGTFAGSVRPDGTVVDDAFDLYEQAFALFALASARRDRPDREALRGSAESLLECLQLGWGHPFLGFEEGAPRTLPLRSNPHMHLLEAALEWIEVSEGRQRAVWETLAADIANLCMARFVASGTGAVHENFDGDWRPAPGAPGGRVEPGHQFEWAWLLMRWARAAQSTQALAVARRLLELGEAHGVDRVRGVAVNALAADLRLVDGGAKVWPQTERIKAWQAAAVDGTPRQMSIAPRKVGEALQGLARFLLPSPPGLWQEEMNMDGSFTPTDCRASSLYHIVCAVDTLQATSSSGRCAG